MTIFLGASLTQSRYIRTSEIQCLRQIWVLFLYTLLTSSFGTSHRLIVHNSAGGRIVYIMEEIPAVDIISICIALW